MNEAEEEGAVRGALRSQRIPSIAFFGLVALCLYGLVESYRHWLDDAWVMKNAPGRSRELQRMRPGGGDFVYPFNGARALLEGVNPYLHEEAHLIDLGPRQGGAA